MTLQKPLLLVVSCLLIVVSTGEAGPEKGTIKKQSGVTAFGSKTFTVNFKGRQRTLIAVSGNKSAVLGLYLFDKNGNCLRRDDKGLGENRSKCAVEWFPHETGPLLIEVRNLGALDSGFHLVIR